MVGLAVMTVVSFLFEVRVTFGVGIEAIDASFRFSGCARILVCL